MAEDAGKGERRKVKEIEDKLGRAETHPEGVSEEEFKEGLKEFNKRNKLWKELSHLQEKHREEQSRLEMLIKEERDRITSLSDTPHVPRRRLKRHRGGGLSRDQFRH